MSGCGSRPVRLVLFDIDGTLLTCGPQVRPLFAAALDEVFGATGDLDAYDFAGRTDQRIVLDLLTGVGGHDEASILDSLPRMRDSYLERLEAGLLAEEMCLLPRVTEVLDHCAARDDLAVGLLTGNWEQGARIKLSRFGLEGYFPFGAFGDDGVDRCELPPVALERAGAHHGRTFRPEEALIVGDSVHDVTCAAAHGVPMIAVATGRTSAERLRAAGAPRVLESLGELVELLDALEEVGALAG